MFFVIFNVTVPSIKSFSSIKGHYKHYKQRFQGKVTQKREIKVIQHTTFSQNRKFKCREICAPQNRKINMSRKFHVISREVFLFVIGWSKVCELKNHLFNFFVTEKSEKLCNFSAL